MNAIQTRLMRIRILRRELEMLPRMSPQREEIQERLDKLTRMRYVVTDVEIREVFDSVSGIHISKGGERLSRTYMPLGAEPTIETVPLHSLVAGAQDEKILVDVAIMEKVQALLGVPFEMLTAENKQLKRELAYEKTQGIKNRSIFVRREAQAAETILARECTIRDLRYEVDAAIDQRLADKRLLHKITESLRWWDILILMVDRSYWQTLVHFYKRGGEYDE